MGRCLLLGEDPLRKHRRVWIVNKWYGLDVFRTFVLMLNVACMTLDDGFACLPLLLMPLGRIESQESLWIV